MGRKQCTETGCRRLEVANGRCPDHPKVGRRALISEERIEAIATALQAGESIPSAAARAGISERTLYSWRTRGEAEDARLADDPTAEEDPGEALYVQFVQTVSRAHADLEAQIVRDLLRVAEGYELKKESRDGGSVYSTEIDWRAGAWLLERKFPERYGNRQRVEHTGADGGPIRSTAAPDLSKLSVDELRALQHLTQKAQRGDA